MDGCGGIQHVQSALALLMKRQIGIHARVLSIQLAWVFLREGMLCGSGEKDASLCPGTNVL
jgi:hypothetical protein